MTVEVIVRAGKGTRVKALVSDEDARWVLARSWRLSKGYPITRVYVGKRNGRSVQRDVPLHRWVLGLSTSDPRQGDHIDRNPLNATRQNLRIVTSAENRQNVGPRSWAKHGKVSGFRGVHWDASTGRWKAAARKAGKLHSLGYFDSPEAAASVASRWRQEHMPFAVEG